MRHLSVKVLETARLILRWLSVEDAEFILRLLNDEPEIKLFASEGTTDSAVEMNGNRESL